MQYEEDLKINEKDLTHEWLLQPVKYMQYAEKSAMADSIRKKAKERLDVVMAGVDNSIREEASSANEKITEKVVESRIKLNSTYQEALRILNEAEYNYSILSSAVRAFEQRKSALENLVRLYIAGYFSAPVEPSSDPALTDLALSDKLSERQRERLNNRRATNG